MADDEAVDPPPEPYPGAAARKGKGDRGTPKGDPKGKGKGKDLKNLPCFEFCKGKCPNSEEKCKYSHSPKICDPWKRLNLKPGSAVGGVTLFKSKAGHIPI